MLRKDNPKRRIHKDPWFGQNIRPSRFGIWHVLLQVKQLPAQVCNPKGHFLNCVKLILGVSGPWECFWTLESQRHRCRFWQ
jgi:hypothetical protein